MLTIAHRLDTVIECETVVVMEAGRVAETGPVCDLLQVWHTRLTCACNGTCLQSHSRASERRRRRLAGSHRYQHARS